MTRLVPLSEACEINPRLPRGHGIVDDTFVSFVPMATIDEVSGSIFGLGTRPFAEVRKGYTPFRENDVLFAKITPCMENGKAALAQGLTNGLGFGSTEFHVLRAREGVMPEWLRYFVRRPSFRQEAKRNFTGTAGQQRVPTDFMSNALIPLPSIDDQKVLVDCLARAEGILRLRREALAKAQLVIPALFLDMFGDPAANPWQWPIAKLSDVAQVQGGLQITRARVNLPLEFPYLRVANVYRSRLDLTEVKTIRTTEAEFHRTRLEPGDLLFVEGHGNPLEVGRVAVWDGSIASCTHQNHLIRARLDTKALLPIFACSLLNSHGGRQSLLRAGKTTSGLSTISAQNVKDAKVMLPPLDLQAKFEGHCGAVNGIIAQQAEALSKAEATFQALLSSAFSSNQVDARRILEEVAA